MDRAARKELAKLRLQRVLEGHGIANSRTLEQKISDGGPFNQRIDPHVLTNARQELVAEGHVTVETHANIPWFRLTNAPDGYVQARLAAQLPVYQEVVKHALTMRSGQTLEIAVYRALGMIEGGEYFGMYSNLTHHDDSSLYSKVEPPSQIGNRTIPGDKKLDFILRHPTAGHMGIECKNVREWMYPNRDELTDLLAKCLHLDCVPVFIARRIPFVTFRIFSACGVIFHQTYNQLFPTSDAALAEQARAKDNLGYHDIRVGNEPDARLKKFIVENMSRVADDARDRFGDYRDLLESHVFGGMGYSEFAARVRRRGQGVNEEHDWGEEIPEWYEGQT